MSREYYGVRRVGQSEEDYLAHINGFKYLDKKWINGRWQYIYQQAQGVGNAIGGVVNNAAKAARNAYSSVRRTAQNAAIGLRRNSNAFRAVDNRLGITRSGAQVRKANAQRARVSGSRNSISDIAKSIGSAAGKAVAGASRAARNAATGLRKSSRAFRAVDNHLGITRSGAQVKKARSQRAKVLGTKNPLQKGLNNAGNAIRGAAGRAGRAISEASEQAGRGASRALRSTRAGKGIDNSLGITRTGRTNKKNAEFKKKALSQRKDYSNIRGFSKSTAEAARRSGERRNWRGATPEHKRYHQEDMRMDKAQRRLTSKKLGFNEKPSRRYFNKDEGWQTNNPSEAGRLSSQSKRRDNLREMRVASARGNANPYHDSFIADRSPRKKRKPTRRG